MKNNLKFGIASVFLVLISLNFIYAATITGDAISVNSDYVTIYPGEEKSVTITVENNGDYDIDDVSVNLILDNIPFTSIGSSEKSQDTIRDGDSEKFTFNIKASSNIEPRDYDIPYTITYNGQNNKTVKTGSFGITVGAKTELNYNIEAKNNVVGEQGKVSLKIINSGLGDIKFVSVKVVSTNGFEILSSQEEYVGTVSSDDFELASFDSLFKSTTASLTAIVTYKNFDNKEQTETVLLSVPVFSREKALELGLIQKPNYAPYIVVAVLIIVWIIYSKVMKKRRARKN